jgi:hypothetical protein
MYRPWAQSLTLKNKTKSWREIAVPGLHTNANKRMHSIQFAVKGMEVKPAGKGMPSSPVGSGSF